MKNFMTVFLGLAFALFGIFGMANQPWAATINAASCSYADVASAITSAAVGETVQVPAGTCAWGSTLDISKGINLMGAGIGQTVIRKGAATIINYEPSNQNTNAPVRISGFTFDLNGEHGTGIDISSGNTLVLQTKLRIDHNRFQNIALGSTQDHYIVFAGIRGVIDNNFFGKVFYPFRTPTSPLRIDKRPSGGILETGGRVEWEHWEGIVFGQADNNIWFEDNIFEELADPSGVALVDCQEGGRYAFRYNTIHLSNSAWHLMDMHGNADAYTYSCMGGEIYGNNITGAGGSMLDHRGGRVFAFNNNSASGISIQVREEFSDSLSPVNYIGPNPPQYPQHVTGSYYWGNRTQYSGPLFQAEINTTCTTCQENGLAENINFWQQGASFNGTSGVGCGPLAARPATCSTGVAYWATNQSCTNLTGMVGANPATPIAGKLYRCIATNTWDAGASPLQYPHPLRSGTPSTPPSAPNRLRVH